MSLDSRFLNSRCTESQLSPIVDQMVDDLNEGEKIDIAAIVERNPALETEIRAAYDSLIALFGVCHDDQPSPIAERRDLGNYRLIQEIGRGGMGIVYEAEELSLGRRVALKVLPFASLLDDRQLQRFKNEARAAAALKHANIVSVFGIGHERSVHFYAMELIEGSDVAELIDRIHADRPISNSSIGSETEPAAKLSTQREGQRSEFYKSVARLGVQTADALQFAHDQGVIHRDIKPANLLLDHNGDVRVADFGLASSADNPSLTMTGDRVGTLRYMSPEQLDGVPVDERTDVYSLGITLYELLAGRPAFDAEHRNSLAQQVAKSTPPKLSKLDSRIPRDLETIIFKATSRSAVDRYRTARELGLDLQRFVESKPVVARNPGPLENARRWVGRNRAFSTLVATVILLLLLLASGSALTALRLSNDAMENEIRLYGQDMRLAYEAARNGDFVTAENTLYNWVPSPGQEDRRGFEWSYIWSLCHDPAIERTFQLRLPVYDIEFVAKEKVAIAWWSEIVPVWDLTTDAKQPPETELQNCWGVSKLLNVPEEERLFIGTRKGWLQEQDTGTGECLSFARLEFPHDESEVRSLAISTDRQLVAVGAGTLGAGHLAVWNRKQSEWVFKKSGFSNPCRVAFGPKDLLYVVEPGSSQIVTIDPESGNETSRSEIGIKGIHRIDATSDAIRIVAIANLDVGKTVIGQVVVWDTENQSVTAVAPVSSETLNCLAITKDCSQIAVGDDAGVIHILDGDTLKVLATKQAHAGIVADLAFSDDGQKLASASSDTYSRVWNVKKLIESNVAHVPLDQRIRFALGAEFLAPKTVVSTDNEDRLFIWNAKTGKTSKVLRLPHHQTNSHQLGISTDRQLVAVTHGHHPSTKLPGFLHLVDANSVEVKWSKPIDSGIYYTVPSFSPDGRFLAIASKSMAIVYDVQTGDVLHELPSRGSWFKPTVFSPDGRWLACGSVDGKIHLFRLPDFKLDRIIGETHEVIDDIQFSPDGRKLVTAGSANCIQVYSLDSGKQVQPFFRKIPAFMVFARFSPDGKRIVTGSLDDKLRIWHAERGQLLLSLEIPRDGYPVGNFSPDGNSVVVAAGPNVWVIAGTDMSRLKRMSKVELNELSCKNLSSYHDE